MTRVVVTGDRSWHLSRYPAIEAALAKLDPEADMVVLGDARGVDTLAALACQQLGVPYRVHRADWKRYGRAAGPRRNAAMLDDAGADAEVWYFHDDLEVSKGTRNCVEQARRRGLVVLAGLETS